MPNAIKTVTDKNEFQDLFYRYFANSTSFLKSSNGNLAIRFLGYTAGEVAFRIPYVKNMPTTCLVFTRKDEVTAYVELKFKDKQEDEVFSFYPLKMQLMFAHRESERKVVGSDAKSLIYATNIISDFIIEKSIALELRKVERIKEAILGEIDQVFTHKKISFINEGMSDPRMKYFYEMGQPYIISNVTMKSDDPVFRSYIENIYSKDYFLINRKNLISEVAVPILYRNSIPFGFLQVNSTVPGVDASMIMLHKLAAVAGELFRRNKVFVEMEDRLLISDISEKGLGIVFKDRKYLRLFKEKSYFHFDLHVGDDLVSMFSVVRNVVLLENKIIKIGCEILKIDPQKEHIFRSFINS